MTESRYSRQSFLGTTAQERFERCTVGIVGLGGGGSHIVQQLAHLGFKRYVLYDGDVVNDVNLNRLVGAKLTDVDRHTRKVDVALRLIRGLHRKARIQPIPCRWQEQPEPLRQCDIIFGCVDTFSERQQLEVCARRYLIPYIDIGMDINVGADKRYVMGGQVILSMPGGPCMSCLGFLTSERLTQETALYGAGGGRPQVVWPNAILASTAVGIAVDLLTNWTLTSRQIVYLSYRGNDGTVQPHVRTKYLDDIECHHYKVEDVGDPVLIQL